MNISIIEPGGLNIELACLFASAGHDVYWYGEFKEAFPSGQRENIGTGFGFKRVLKLSEALDHGDIIICPDTHSDDYLQLAKKYNKPTWGTGAKAERLEQDRLFAKQLLTRLGLPVGEYNSGIGITSLELELKQTKDRFIKFPGAYRGIAETRHHYDWAKTKTEWWGQLLQDLGPLQNDIPWISETPIEHVMEVAADQLVVNGEYSLPTLVGIEDKDSAYIGKMFNELPKPLQETNNKLAPFLRSSGAKTFFSPELMLTEKGKALLTDPCLRTGHPVSASQLDIYKNLCEYIIQSTLNSEKPYPVVDKIIKPTYQYSLALEIKSTSLEDSWLEIQFNPKHRYNIHLQNAMKRGDKYWVIPKSFIAAIIVTCADSIEDCEKQLHKVLDEFSCAGMYYDLNSINKIKAKLKKGASVGINF